MGIPRASTVRRSYIFHSSQGSIRFFDLFRKETKEIENTISFLLPLKIANWRKELKLKTNGTITDQKDTKMLFGGLFPHYTIECLPLRFSFKGKGLG